MVYQTPNAKNAKSDSCWDLIKHIKTFLKHGLMFLLAFCLVLSPNFIKISAEDVNWTEVANTGNGIQFIDAKSIKYKNNDILYVLSKYSELNPDNQKIINTNTYLMAIDCENRLFSKLPVNSDLIKVKKWDAPINDKLIKKTIINSCSY